MGILGEMKVVFSADTSKLTSGISSAQGAVQKFGGVASAISPVAGVFMALGAAAVGFGAQSVQTAADFQQSDRKSVV